MNGLDKSLSGLENLYSTPEALPIHPTLIEEMEREDLEGIGKEIEERFSKLEYGEEAPKSGGEKAIYATNERWYREDQERELRNGSIIGIGAGAIFSILELYDKDAPPGAILSCDIQPGPILAGRVLKKVLQNSETRIDMTRHFRDNLDQHIEAVIEEEENRSIRILLRDSIEEYKEEVEEGYSMVPLRFYSKNPKDLELATTIEMNSMIHRNWQTLKEMADKENMAFVIAGITDGKFIEEAKSIKSKFKGDTVVYVTNAIDHIAERWLRKYQNHKYQKFWDNNVGQLNDERTKYIGTTGKDRYVLKTTNNPPQYNIDGYQIA